MRRLAIAIGLLCALLGSQAPEFAQQYRQRLGGALDEIERMIAQFDSEVAGQSLTRTEGLVRLEKNDDPLARQRGEALTRDIERAERLQRQQAAMKDAGPLTRLAALLENFDAATARQAIADFEPAVPVSVEAFIIAAGGLLLGWGATHLFAWPIRRRIQRRRGERAARAG